MGWGGAGEGAWKEGKREETHHSRLCASLLGLEEDGFLMIAYRTCRVRPWELYLGREGSQRQHQVQQMRVDRNTLLPKAGCPVLEREGRGEEYIKPAPVRF